MRQKQIDAATAAQHLLDAAKAREYKAAAALEQKGGVEGANLTPVPAHSPPVGHAVLLAGSCAVSLLLWSALPTGRRAVFLPAPAAFAAGHPAMPHLAERPSHADGLPLRSPREKLRETKERVREPKYRTTEFFEKILYLLLIPSLTLQS